MRRSLISLFLLCCFVHGSSQDRDQAFVSKVVPPLPDSLFSTYYHQRVGHFSGLPKREGSIIFLGNSMTDGAEWSELFEDARIKNRGISGDVSAGVLHRLPQITSSKPEKVFLLIGINDLTRNVSPDSLVKNISSIASYVHQQSPRTRLYVESILPVNSHFGSFGGHTGKIAQIEEVNKKIALQASSNAYTFVNLYPHFLNGQGQMDTVYTDDGLHLNGRGCLLWKHLLYPYVYDLAPKASLLPLPQKLQWQQGSFPLLDEAQVIVEDARLWREASLLQQKIAEKGGSISASKEKTAGKRSILLRLSPIATPTKSEEAYHLEVTPEAIELSAPTPHGIFNGLQTLLQLMRDGGMVDACSITDWPSFSWRGYMVDVGRNYQSMDLLRQQIEIMSHYKLNIFHLHLTEDVAWRLEVPGFAALTDPRYMERNKGMYYSVRELEELIQYCRERYITLVPEIDMPGHSAAFQRAVGLPMQSAEGLAIVKKILTSICTTYDVPYLHLGGDEVAITYAPFLPSVIRLVDSLGKKVIGWDPGGRMGPQVMHQLWMRDGPKDSSTRYIDSRHLYLNHMDPLESVMTIFCRRIGDQQQENAQVKGGTLCLWNDRMISKEEDLLRENPVYPAMMAFAERSWQGGGWKGWLTSVQTNNPEQCQAFCAFEQRLLDHRQQNFEGLPFPYVAQSGMTWKLYGPYQNDGNLQRTFDPEKGNFSGAKTVLEAIGGTVILRHFWHPLVSGVLPDPQENTTWYAVEKLWSEEDTTMQFWIGFNNLSRSYNTDSPRAGTWNDWSSQVWINGMLIAPPQWKRPGRKGASDLPLMDEGYEYRSPIFVPLHKGWNTVMMKLPVGSFKGKDGQNPVKWMGTVVPYAVSANQSK